MYMSRWLPKCVPSFYKSLWDGMCIKERKGPNIQVLETERNLRWFEMTITPREAYVDSKRVYLCGEPCILMSVDIWEVQHSAQVEG